MNKEDLKFKEERVDGIKISYTEYTRCRCEFMGDFIDGIARVEDSDKYGFIDRDWNEIVPFIYDDADDFDEGIARVKRGRYYGYVDKTGKEIVPCEYERASFYGSKIHLSLGGEDKYININELDFKQNDNDKKISEGLTRVEFNGKYGYADETGKGVIPCKYSIAEDFSGDFALVGEEVVVKQKSSVKKQEFYYPHETRYGYVDKTGKEVVPCLYEEIGAFSEGIVCAQQRDKYGYINKNGQVISPFIFDEAGDFSEGLACVKYNRKYGYINKTGKIVIECQYADAQTFSEGLACVEYNYKYGYIDKRGEVIIGFDYEEAYDFCEGVALVRYNGEYIHIDKNNSFIAISKKRMVTEYIPLKGKELTDLKDISDTLDYYRERLVDVVGYFSSFNIANRHITVEDKDFQKYLKKRTTVIDTINKESEKTQVNTPNNDNDYEDAASFKRMIKEMYPNRRKQ